MTYIVSCMYIAHCMKRHFTSFSRSSQIHLVPSGSGADVHVLCMGKPSQSNQMFDIRVYIYTHPFCYMYKMVPNINQTNDPNLGEYSPTWSLWDVVTCSGYIWKNSQRDLRQIMVRIRVTIAKRPHVSVQVVKYVAIQPDMQPDVRC